jgi:hypothetical protein
LEEPERDLWNSILSEFEIDTASELAILADAMLAHMRARTARERIAAEGEMLVNRFGQSYAHPLLQVERMSQKNFLVAMTKLRLDMGTQGLKISTRPRP